VAYLLETMTDDGRWEDRQASFTIFARSFYYHYPLFACVLPLLALTEYVKAGDRG
jgi:hypothetical protein